MVTRSMCSSTRSAGSKGKTRRDIMHSDACTCTRVASVRGRQSASRASAGPCPSGRTSVGPPQSPPPAPVRHLSCVCDAGETPTPTRGVRMRDGGNAREMCARDVPDIEKPGGDSPDARARTRRNRWRGWPATLAAAWRRKSESSHRHLVQSQGGLRQQARNHFLPAACG